MKVHVSNRSEPLASNKKALEAACKLAAVLLASALTAGCGRQSGEAERLAADKGCMRCHTMHSKFVGPGFEQVASRYRGDASASERLAGKIRHGGVGDWGRVIMPRQSQVTPAEAKALADWVLAQTSKE